MEHQPQGIFHGHEQLKILLSHLWYDKPGWFIGRQHLANHFILTPLGEQEMHVKAYSSIVQYNVDYSATSSSASPTGTTCCTKAQRRVAVQVHAHLQVDGRRRARGWARTAPGSTRRRARSSEVKGQDHEHSNGPYRRRYGVSRGTLPVRNPYTGEVDYADHPADRRRN